MTRVLFVCLGNICRSPTADGVFRELVREAGLAGAVEVDSAGTAAYHTGNPPDPRTVAAAARRGYDLSALRARQAVAADLARFDYVLAMDRSNLANLRAIAPAGGEDRLGLFLAYAANYAEDEVPDPYYSGPDGFELVLDMVEDACRGLLDEVKRRGG